MADELKEPTNLPAENEGGQESEKIGNLLDPSSEIDMVSKKNSSERNWYAVHTYSGYEDAVVRYLKQRVETLGMEDKIFNVLVPKEKKVKRIHYAEPAF